MSEQFVYQIARIRSLETSLFSGAVMDQLIACPDFDQCINFITERGWGKAGAVNESGEDILEEEEEKIRRTLRELRIDKKYFDVLLLPKSFHNLKTAIKDAVSEQFTKDAYYKDALLTPEEIAEIIRNKEFRKLPSYMQKCADEAFESLLHTSDGQLCDIIVDRACLDAITEAGKSSGEEVIRDYAEKTVALSNIKIAVRSANTGKGAEFMKRAMSPCATIDTGRLLKAAEAGFDALKDYISTTKYAESTEALSESHSAFEKWCDDAMIKSLKAQKYNSFSIGPVLAYVIARENEIKAVRIILSGKLNGISDTSIRERVREMYV